MVWYVSLVKSQITAVTHLGGFMSVPVFARHVKTEPSDREALGLGIKPKTFFLRDEPLSQNNLAKL